MKVIEDVTTEDAVLGAVLVSDPAVERVVEVGLAADDFYLDKNRAAFAAVLRLAGRGEPVDQLTVKAELERAGDLEAAGGADRLDALAAQVAAPGNVRAHAERLTELSRQRRIRELLDQAAEALDGGILNGEVRVLADAILEADIDQGRRTELLDLDGLRNLTPPAWLVRDHLVENGLNLLYGHPGTGKSFLALDWSLSVATGKPWLDSPVKRGPVVYVAAEGAHGLRNRIEAWRHFHRIDRLDGFAIWPEPVNLYRRETGPLEAAIRRLDESPVLLVIDTVARSMAGGDENGTADMSVVVDEVGRLQRKYGMAALLIHHPRKGSEEPRGNSALVGAIDTSRYLKVDDGTRLLTAKKTKDWRDPEPVGFALEALENSAVIRPRTVREASGRFEREADGLLETVREEFGTVWTSTADLRQVSDLSRTAFYEVLKRLTDGEKLEMRKAGAQRREYRLAEAEATVRNRPEPSTGTVANRPSVTASLVEADGHGRIEDQEGKG